MIEFRLPDCPNSGAARWRGSVRVREVSAGVYDLAVFLAAGDNDASDSSRIVHVTGAAEGATAGCWRTAP